MREKNIGDKKHDKQYLEIATSKNVKQVLNIIDNIIAGQRFGELDSGRQMYLLDCQARIYNMLNNKFTENDIVFLIQTIDSLTKILNHLVENEDYMAQLGDITIKYIGTTEDTVKGKREVFEIERLESK